MRVLHPSLDFYFFLSLCLWMSVSVSSYIMTHCICVYFSSSWYLFPCSLNIRINVRLYCDSLYVYSSRHLYLCFPLSVSISAYITANSACICTPLYLCFPLTFCLWMCTPVSEYIIHSWCICTCLDPCFCLSFSMIVYVCVRLYRHWLYVYRYVCYSAYLSISLYVCLCQCPGILLVIWLYVNKQVRLSQCIIAL